MRADDLDLLDLISIQDGNINFRGRRLVLHSIHAFSQFRFDIIAMLGEDHARQLFTRFGYFWGQADAAALQRTFKWPSVEEWIRAGLKLHALEGVVQSDITQLTVNKELNQFHMDITWHDSVEVEEHLMDIDPGDNPVCWKFIGYVSGLTSYCLGQNIIFMETHCQGKRDNVCQATGKDTASWGDKITPHLRYFNAEDIKGTVKRLTNELKEKTRKLNKQKRELKKLTRQSASYFVEGRSKSMQDIVALASQVAKYDSSVLITGETGTGKEVLAKYIHDSSNRSKGPFVVINCVAMPESLLESELFGYKAGSFTGAVKSRVGLFEEASNGTVFLDEIGDISQTIQLKILRVLQEKEVLRIGENKPRKSNVRVIAATNKDLDEAVKNRVFREDLLYRLRVIEIELPALRNRIEDIVPISKFLIEKISARLDIKNLHMDASCAELLESYDWPGNIRELENSLERAAVISPDGIILPEHLPIKVVHQTRLHSDTPGSLYPTLKKIEVEHIRRVLDYTDGNRTEAARILGISNTTLWRKLKED